MDHRPAKINPDGFVAQRLTKGGEDRWVLTHMQEGAGLTVTLIEDDEAADWPNLQIEGSAS